MVATLITMELRALESRFSTLFWRWAVVVLGLIALSKAFSLAQPIPLFEELDPIFTIKKRYLYLTAILLELLVAGFIALCEDFRARGFVLSGLCGAILLYRLGLKVSGYGDGCRCLGRLLDWFPLVEKHESWIAFGVLLFLLLGAIFFGLFTSYSSQTRKL
jgi:hypothetical protein